jgi:hypothetical protein
MSRIECFYADYLVMHRKEILENMYSCKRISMIEQFLYGTKRRLNGIILEGLPKQEEF